MLTGFYVVVLGHLIADFLLQSTAVALNKRGLNKYMLAHVLIVAILFLLSLLVVNALSLVAVVVMFGLHLAIDIVKKEIDIMFKPKDKAFWTMIGLDQIAHLTSIFWILDRVVFS